MPSFFDAMKLMFDTLFPSKRLLRALEDENCDLRKKLATTEARLLEVQIRAETDHLTGLANALNARERFVGEMSMRSRKTTASVVGAFIDLDGFGSVNKLYGQAKGDIIIQSFAKKLRAAFRPQDIVFRLGGDEFCILLVDTHVENGSERIRHLMDMVHTDPEFSSLGVTASIGLTTACIEPELGGKELETTYECVLAEADRAMRVAKARGKNCVVASDEIIPA